MQSLEGGCEEGERAAKKIKNLHSSLLRHHHHHHHHLQHHPQEPPSSSSSESPNLLHLYQQTSASLSCTPLESGSNNSGSAGAVTSATATSTSTTSGFCIFTKFRELYEEETARIFGSGSGTYVNGLKSNSNILEKLVARERLNTLILNLYPGNKGYSLAFRTASVTSVMKQHNNSDDFSNFNTANNVIHYHNTNHNHSNSSSSSITNNSSISMIETKQWPYEEDELLRYIDNEELPPYLVDLFETHYSFLFYNGCVIAEVRDYRQSYPHFKCDIHHVLLRPTLKSILADINNIVEEKSDWGSEERQQLESQMLVANSPTLCLGPDNSVGSFQSQINHNRMMWNAHPFRRTARKFSQVTVNRKRKLDQFTHRPGLELFEFMSRARTKLPKTSLLGSSSSSSSGNIGLPSTNSVVASGAPITSSSLNRPATSRRSVQEEIVNKPVPVPNLDAPPIGPPSQGVFINEFKTYQRPKDTSDCLPQLIEEYVLETDMPSKEKGKQRVYHIKLSIFQRPSNSEYLGELYLDRDHKKNERNGVACRFSLGSRANANRYIHQFTEIFTESGRKSVRIRYGLSPGYKERVAMAQAQAQMQAQNAAAQSSNLAQQHLAQLSQSLQNQTTNSGGSTSTSIGVSSSTNISNNTGSIVAPTPVPLANGAVTSRISIVQPQPQQQPNQILPNTSSVPILQSHLQAGTSASHQQIIKSPTSQISNQDLAISALATKLMNSAEEFQAANAKQQQQQQQQQKLVSSRNNAAIINLLNSSPASNINSDASAAVVNAINNAAAAAAAAASATPSLLLPQQHQQPQQTVQHPQTITLNQHQKQLLARKMTLAAAARVLTNHNNNNNNNSGSNNSTAGGGSGGSVGVLGTTNNNRISLSELGSQLLSQQQQQQQLLVQQQQQQQGQHHHQTITLTSVNSGGVTNYTNYTTVPIKSQVINQQLISASNTSASSNDSTTNSIISSSTTTTNNNSSNKSALSALLVGTPAADRPDIVGPSNTTPLLLEKLAAAAAASNASTAINSTTANISSQNSHFIQSLKSGGSVQYMLHHRQSPSPSNKTLAPAPSPNSAAGMVQSPMSSPPPAPRTPQQQSLSAGSPQPTNTINFAQLQNIPGLQNVQVQLLSLNVSSTGGHLQGHPTTSLLVSLPATAVTTATIGSSNTITQQVGAMGTPTATVVLANAGASNLAQLVSSGVKGLASAAQQQTAGGGIRTLSPSPNSAAAAVSLSQNSMGAGSGVQPSFQLLTPFQQPRRIQQQQQQQQQLSPAAVAIQQQNLGATAAGVGRPTATIQRTPVTIKMATASPTSAANTAASVAAAQQQQQQSASAAHQHLQQKQAQYQQYHQQLLLNQQSAVVPPTGGKVIRRRSTNASSDQQ